MKYSLSAVADLDGCADAIGQGHQDFLEGVHLQAQGDAKGAQARFRSALRALPDLAEAWSNLGMLLEDERCEAEAEACYRRALALNGQLHAALLNLATLLASQQRFAAAEACYRRGIEVRPGDASTWSNLGAMLSCMRRDEDAQACLLRALQLRPDYDKARFNLGYLWMRQGRLAEGALCNESRPFPAVLQDKLGITRWAGEPLNGRTVLLATDAAHGDLIQMCRYVPVLKAMGAARVGIWGQPALKGLIKTVEGLDACMAFDEPFAPSAWDCWAPLMSLPHLCAHDLEDIPSHLPYLHADTERVRQRAAQGMRPVLDMHGRSLLRVGLVWRGNPLHENDAQRSLTSLAQLVPLWRVPGVRFFSLQSGAGEEEALNPPEGLRFEALQAPLGDFAETAAVVANLDLVIGVDTSMVHLAGALGKPVWVLLCDYKTDWRWMDHRSDSPWYPEVMRLFRQDASGQWAPVIEQLAQALAELVAQHTTSASSQSAGHAPWHAERSSAVPHPC